MIEDPTEPPNPFRPVGRRVPARTIDFDRLDELDDPDDRDVDDERDGDGSLESLDERSGTRATLARPRAEGGRRDRGAPGGGAGLLLRLVRPWFDPRPGELRGVIILLAAGLILTTALWFDAARRPSGAPPQSFAPITAIGAEDDWSGDAQPSERSPVAPTEVVVHVSGAVTAPGLLVLATGARVGDAILAAGGASAEAELDRLNLARILEDGEQVHVPRMGEEVTPRAGAVSRGILADGRVDVNVASAEELVTLPGIGPARAQAIIATREERPFAVPGDLRRVPGIGEATFQRLAPLISVG